MSAVALGSRGTLGGPEVRSQGEPPERTGSLTPRSVFPPTLALRATSARLPDAYPPSRFHQLFFSTGFESRP